MQFKHWARKILGYNGPPDHVDFSLVETGEEQELISENNDKDNVATSKSQRHKIRKPKKLETPDMLMMMVKPVMWQLTGGFSSLTEKTLLSLCFLAHRLINGIQCIVKLRIICNMYDTSAGKG